ncbi:MAG: hypothetical protein AAF401_16670 [Pseudomonadota bacterium]
MFDPKDMPMYQARAHAERAKVFTAMVRWVAEGVRAAFAAPKREAY